MYRNADYERDWDRLSTASHPEAVVVEQDDLLPVVRRTNSAGDVARFHRYFQLLRRHMRSLTWKQYSQLVRQRLLEEAAAHKTTTTSIPSVSKSERSCYVTASESHGSARKVDERDDVSISSVSTLASVSSTSWNISPNGHIKKLRKETKSFARGIFKSLDFLYKIQSKKFETSPTTSKKSKKHVVKTVVRDQISPVPSIYGSQRSVSSVCTSNSSVKSGGGDSLTLSRLTKKMLINVDFI